MPLVEIDVLRGRSEEELDAICVGVHAAMVETLDVPEHDRFQIITEREPRTLRFDRRYLQADRSEGFVLIRLTLASGRSTEVKRAFYARVLERLVEAVGVREDDLAVVLVENGREDWSFGRGQASYLEIPKEDWR